MHPTEADGRLLILTGPRTDDGRIEGVHLELGPCGVRPRPWRLAYRTPHELDVAAAASGLTLMKRSGDWQGESPVTLGARHVSWYVKE